MNKSHLSPQERHAASKKSEGKKHPGDAREQSIEVFGLVVSFAEERTVR
ncbi:MAG: hypothetical protein U0T84_08250 [Chitinophagales bacterium]